MRAIGKLSASFLRKSFLFIRLLVEIAAEGKVASAIFLRPSPENCLYHCLFQGGIFRGLSCPNLLG